MWAKIRTFLPWGTVPVVVQKVEPVLPRSGFFSTDAPDLRRHELSSWIQANAFPVTPKDQVCVDSEGRRVAFDSFTDAGISSQFALGQSRLPEVLGAWYVSQGFIGYQACALLAQQWLVDKACTQGPQDAARNGYELTRNDGEKLDPATLDKIRALDKSMKVSKHLVEFARFNRVFGIRIAIFDVRSDDPLYYEKPFNIDGVTRGSYRGVSQVDPYWITPELDADAAANPGSRFFYEPTYWRISGRRYHRSHLVIIRGPEVADVLKPSYLYGGLPLTQRIYERVYAAERTANEAPQLALTKRTTTIKTDVAAALANQAEFEQKLQLWVQYRDNYAIKVIGEDEELQQFDTALGDLDVTIMTQYQLVSAIARVPATKLLGTSPKGFNATGEFEESSYHEELESIQSHEMNPLLERHYLLLARSHIGDVHLQVVWNPLDALTAKEEAEIQELKSRTATAYFNAGAISGEDIRAKIAADPSSGFNGIEVAEPMGAELEEPVTDADTVNSALQNLTGRQYQQVLRVARDFSRGKLSPDQASVMLRSGFGLTEADLAAVLGTGAEE